jgi:hypothetical protein
MALFSEAADAEFRAAHTVGVWPLARKYGVAAGRGAAGLARRPGPSAADVAVEVELVDDDEPLGRGWLAVTDDEEDLW